MAATSRLVTTLTTAISAGDVIKEPAVTSTLLAVAIGERLLLTRVDGRASQVLVCLDADNTTATELDVSPTVANVGYPAGSTISTLDAVTTA